MANGSVADELNALFSKYNLAGLAKAVLDLARKGVTDAQLELRLQETKEWQARFAGNEARRQKGLRVLSAAEYLARETEYVKIARKYELPPGFLDDQNDWAKLIGGDIDTEELNERLDARRRVLTDGAASGVLAYAKANYGLSTGDLMAMYIDPARAAPILTRMARASEIGAAAARTGYGAVSKAEAERLDNLGITASQAEQNFAQAAELKELTQDVGGSAGISREDITGAIFDQNAEARRRVAGKQAERVSRFQGGGTFAESRTGIAGLGSANT